MTNTHPELLQKKFDYEKTFEELIAIASHKTCVDPNVVTELREVYLSLKKENLASIEEKASYYIREANKFKQMIDTCR